MYIFSPFKNFNETKIMPYNKCIHKKAIETIENKKGSQNPLKIPAVWSKYFE